MGYIKDKNQAMMPTAKLQERLDSHNAPTEVTQEHDRLKSLYKALIKEINENVSDGRAKSTALTDLETSFMWVGKALFTPVLEPQKPVSLTEEKAPHTIVFDGSKSPYYERWLGDDFVSWGNRNVSGQVKDEIVLTVQTYNQGIREVPSGALLHRYDLGVAVEDRQ